MKGITTLSGWLLIGLALAASFAIDLINTHGGGAINLRNRITGVRLLDQGIDPYHYKWTTGDPPEFFDFCNNPCEPVSKTTVTPTLLLLHAPLAALPYRPGQYLWLIIQWAALLGTGWLWWRLATTPFTRWLVPVVVLALSYTVEWRWHSERGQVYVVLDLLFAYWLTSTLNPRRADSPILGFLAGFLTSLRPTFIILLPFLAFHRRGQLPGAIIGLALGVALPMVIHPTAWSEYSTAMTANSALYRTQFKDTPDTQSHPATVEGMPLATLAYWKPMPIGNFSIHGFLLRLGLEPFPPAIILALFGALFAAWLWTTRRQPGAQLFPGIAAWFFLADLFLPAPRYGYYDVVILNALLAGIILAQGLPRASWPCLAALPLGCAVYILAPNRPTFINSPALFLTLGAILFLFTATSRPRPIEEDPGQAGRPA